METHYEYEIHFEYQRWVFYRVTRGGGLEALFNDLRREFLEQKIRDYLRGRGQEPAPVWMIPWASHRKRPVSSTAESYWAVSKIPADIEVEPARHLELIAQLPERRCRHFNCELVREFPEDPQRNIYCEFHTPRVVEPLSPLAPYRERLREAKRRAKRMGIKFGSFYNRNHNGRGQSRLREVWNDSTDEMEYMQSLDPMPVAGDYRNGGLGVTGCRRIPRGYPELEGDPLRWAPVP